MKRVCTFKLHAVACCLKAVCTADAAIGVEQCRLSCGGHGYMTSSNLPNTYGLVTAMCTYEGENTVLLLQTARFLIKSWQNKKEIADLLTVNYLCNPEVKPFDKTVDWIISAIKLVAARFVLSIHQYIIYIFYYHHCFLITEKLN